MPAQGLNHSSNLRRPEEFRSAGNGAADRHDPWIATLAHELRTPLNAVVLALLELQPICAKAPSATAARRAAEHASRQMGRIIEDVLELCGGARGKLQVRWEPVDMASVVAGAVEATRWQFAQRGHRLTVSLPPCLPTLEAQSSRVEQILTNLLSNAAKFTDAGGEVSLIIESHADAMILRVRDNGIGISPELLPRIFDAYRQGPAPRGLRQGGLGIGLALVKLLIEAQGGTVAAHSDGAGKGSEFVVRLPTRAARNEDYLRELMAEES